MDESHQGGDFSFNVLFGGLNVEILVRVEKRFASSVKKLAFVQTVDGKQLPSGKLIDSRTSISIPRNNPEITRKRNIDLVKCRVITPDGQEFSMMLNPNTLEPVQETERMNFGKFLQNIRN